VVRGALVEMNAPATMTAIMKKSVPYALDAVATTFLYSTGPLLDGWEPLRLISIWPPSLLAVPSGQDHGSKDRPRSLDGTIARRVVK
jgi:hypothetical protein